MLENTFNPFTRTEALDLWSWMVAGWADSLDASGARTRLDGIPNAADAGGSYEGVTRMLWGLGSWLSYPDRPSTLTWRGRTYDLEALTTRALVSGCEPDSRGYWGSGVVNPRGDQRTVESGQVGFALWQTRDRIWSRLSSREQANVIAFLDRFGARPAVWASNWALFWVLNHTARKRLGAPHDPAIIQEVMFDYLDGVYCGDGWYDDAAQRGANAFDDYNTWVFAMHVMAWAVMDGDSLPARRDELLDRVRAWMRYYPLFFAADGAYCEFGRSLAYKFARLGAPLWAYKLGLWDQPVGMLRRLVGRHLRWYVDRGALRPDGTLRQSLTASGSPSIIERYISTGAPYWAMQAFSGLWALPDDDPFWTADEVPLPAEQSDYVKVFPQPGWIVAANDGHVQRCNAGSVKPGYGGKYAKFVYSTRHPFNCGLDAGQPSLDSNLCLIDDGIRAQRESNLVFAVGENWIRMRYIIAVNGHQHAVDTTLIPLGDVHLRAHRITLDPAADGLAAQEGSAPLGYDAGAVPTLHRHGDWLFAEVGGNGIGILPIAGYTSPASVSTGSANSVYGENVVAVLHAAPLNPPHDLICACYAGGVPALAALPLIEAAGWDADGAFTGRVNGQAITVPPLAVI